MRKTFTLILAGRIILGLLASVGYSFPGIWDRRTDAF